MFSRLFRFTRSHPWVGLALLFSAILGLGILSLGLAYEKARQDWQNTLMPGTLGPCLRLGGFGLPSDSPTVLLAGDSRILHGVIPDRIATGLHKRTRNIADQLNMGGDLSTLALTLRLLSPKSRQSISLLVVNMTATGLIDRNDFNLSGTEFNHYSLRNQWTLARQNPTGFWKQATGQLWPNQWRAWRGLMISIPTSCDGPFAMLRPETPYMGFIPLPPRSNAAHPKQGLAAYRKPQTLGLRYALALQNLRDINTLFPKSVFLFPPIDTSDCKGEIHSRLCAAEWNLPQRIAQDLPELKERILNFLSPGPLGLRHEHFLDLYHLDSVGADILSRNLADTLRSRGYADP